MPRDFNTFCAEHMEEIAQLADEFADYQPVGGVGQPRIMRWLRQFQNQHRELALRLARAILYYSTHSINGMLRTLRGLINQQINAEDAPPGSVFYIPGGRTAESGPSILHRFRNVNRMQRSKQFIELHEAPQRILALQRQRPVFFFLDDFVATGKQISGYWRDVVSQLVPEYFPVYLGVIAAFPDGINRVENETPLTVLAVNELSSRHQLLGTANNNFTNPQKRTLHNYCNDWGNHPLGHGDVGTLVSFSHGTPNNAPSVIRGSERQSPRHGILPGWEDL